MSAHSINYEQSGPAEAHGPPKAFSRNTSFIGGSAADEEDARDMIRLARGNESALNSLMSRHAKSLFHYLCRALQNKDDAADLAQKTFIRVFQNRTKFDPHRKFSTWLYTIASHLVCDHYRWRTRHPKVSLEAIKEATSNGFIESLPEESPSPGDNIQTQERVAVVRDAVAALPEQLRLPLILSEYQEKSHAEIGVILGCSAKAVEMRLYRARQHLRGSLSQLLETS